MLTGGAAKWEELGTMASAVGITFWPVVWGFVAAFAEVVGGICVAIGFLFRPACLLLTATMIGALVFKLQDASTFGYWIEYAELATAFFAMLLMGPGRFSLSVSMNK
jgi:putative oxidoreductase